MFSKEELGVIQFALMGQALTRKDFKGSTEYKVWLKTMELLADNKTKVNIADTELNKGKSKFLTLVLDDMTSDKFYFVYDEDRKTYHFKHVGEVEFKVGVENIGLHTVNISQLCPGCFAGLMLDYHFTE